MNFPREGIRTKHFLLRPILIEDSEILWDYQLRNRAHLKPWEPLRDDAFYTLNAVRQRLAEMTRQMDTNQALYLVLIDPECGQMLGECNFTHIMRGAFNACYLGFSLDQKAQGKGLMREALQLAIKHMFEVEQLHRIMANYRPENTRSGSVLKRLGFEEEGRARAYLKINGQWADHILTALINDRL